MNLSDDPRLVRLTTLTPALIWALVEVPAALAGRPLLARHHGRQVELDTGWLIPGAEPEGGVAAVLTAALPAGLEPGAIGTLALRGDGRAKRLTGRAMTPDPDPGAIATACRERFDSAARSAIAGFLAAAPQRHRLGLTASLAAALATAHGKLRDPLPRTELEPGACAARLEAVDPVDEYGFWLTGLFHGPEPERVALTAVSPEGARAAVEPGAVSFTERPAYAKLLQDDDEHSTLGLRAYIELPDPSRHPVGWTLEFHPVRGDAVEDVARDPVAQDGAPAWEHVMESLRTAPVDERALAHQVLPTIIRRRGGAHDAQVQRTHEFGAVPAGARTTLVIALRNLDRIEHLLAQFARDPEIDGCELLWVLPPLGGDGAQRSLAEELAVLYDRPMRLAELTRPCRRPRALNLGAGLARGDELVLMSGDLLPDAPGWLGVLRAMLGSGSDIGAVGPKLLNEDDSIAHAGTEFARGRGDERWQRVLPSAGMGRATPAANSPRPVTALSDACLALSAESFAAAGGFPELYLREDEAVDVCLRLAEQGLWSWYVPGAELYLLERTGPPRAASPAGSRFDDWLLDWRWGPQLSAEPPRPAAEPVP